MITHYRRSLLGRLLGPLLFGVAPVVVATCTLHAQQPAGNPCAVFELHPTVDLTDQAAVRLRMRQLQGAAPLHALTIRRSSLERAYPCADSVRTPADLFAVTLLPVRSHTIHNSSYPVDVNNGAMWAGRGTTSAFSGGVELRLGPVSAAAYPVISFQENRAFQTVPVTGRQRSEFAYPWHAGLDWPQRHGDEAFRLVDPGQSYVRVEAFGAAAGLSTENMWLGPALRYPLLMSNSGAGFPHVFVSTTRPHDIGIGTVEAQLFWGRLSESGYFDGVGDNDSRLIAGVSAVFEPAFARGLFLGMNRMYLAYTDGWGFEDYLLMPYTDVRGNPAGDNQLFSLYGRWAHPASGFEVYAEWGREDHWGEWIDLLREPDHSQVYMLGLQKVGRWRDAGMRWFGELVHLQSALPVRGGRGAITFYTHSQITQGFTHRGQLLGAAVGPGSDAQIIGAERVADRRSTRLAVERIRYDDDAYYNSWARFYGETGHDVSIGGSIRHTEMRGRFAVVGGLSWSRRHNRNFVYFDGTHPANFQSDDNVQLELDVRWTPGW
jgi:hypothetical protein